MKWESAWPTRSNSTALPHLIGDLKDKFFTYMSLSSPHMGYMYNSNKLFDAGMWFLKKWRKSKCLT